MVAVTLTAVALTTCGQQAASPNAWDLNHVGPVKAADAIPELIAALRSQLKPDPVAGVDVPTVYAAMDKQLAPLLADFQALLVQAPQQIGTAPGPIVKGSVAQSAGQASVALLAANVPGREYFINKTYDAGEQFTGGGMVENVKGVSEGYAENGQVVVHMDMTGEATKVTGDGATAQTSVLVQSLLIGERVAADGTKTGQKTYVDLCPDDAGLSHGKLYFQLAAAGNVDGPAGQQGGQANFIVTADLLGHVDDSATLTSYDLNNLSIQRSATGSASSDSAGFFADGVSLTGVPPTSDAWTSTGNAVAGPSARTAIHNMKQSDAMREIGLMVLFAKFHVQEMYRIAEKAWQQGHCVDVVVTKGPDPKGLSAGQSSRFTAEVHHKPDGAQLEKPIVASDPVNGVVNPDGKPTMAPAEFTFTAGSGRPRYVELSSTSLRGIGKLTVYFLTSYKLTITVHLTGVGIPTQDSKLTGTIVPDPTNTFLEGPGTYTLEIYAGDCGAYKDYGPTTQPAKLKAVVKGDGSFELQVDYGFGFNPIGTFPAAGGAGQGTQTAPGTCGPATWTYAVQADPA